jgi:putative nucleotidyltransferase with HDIG domain
MAYRQPAVYIQNPKKEYRVLMLPSLYKPTGWAKQSVHSRSLLVEENDAYSGVSMGRLSIDQIKPGMLTGEDLVSANGRVLLGKGVELTEKHLRVLKMWNIMDAEIDGVSAEDAGAASASTLDPEILQEAINKTKQRFLLTDLEHPAIHELFRLCTLRQAGRIAEAGFTEAQATLECPVVYTGVGEPGVNLPHINAANLLKDRIKLPTLPDIFVQIQDVINNPRSSGHSIANVIGKDAGLAARLLRLVNSPFYGFPSKVDTLSRAVTIVGTKQLSTLALGVTVTRMFVDIPEDLVDLKSFWRHSVACGLFARALAKHKKISNSERLFVGGLLHDIGRMVIYGYLSGHAREALLRARETPSPLHGIESQVMGCTHQAMGAALLRKWRFPLTLESMVSYHHAPMKSKQPMDSAIVHIADLVVNALEMGSSGEQLLPPLDHQAWEMIGIPASVLGPSVNQLDSQLNEIVQFFFSDK